MGDGTFRYGRYAVTIVPESERKLVQFEFERMIENSMKLGPNNKFEKVRYMELVMRAMGAGKRYNDLEEALKANADAYDGLHVTSSNAGMIAGEIRNAYFRGNMENTLINGLARHDSHSLAFFLRDRLTQL